MYSDTVMSRWVLQNRIILSFTAVPVAVFAWWLLVIELNYVHKSQS